MSDPDPNTIIAAVLRDLIIYGTRSAVDAVKRALARAMASNETERRQKLEAGLRLYAHHAYGDAVPLLRAGIHVLDGSGRRALTLVVTACLFMSGRLTDARRLTKAIAKQAEEFGEQSIRFTALLQLASIEVSAYRLDSAEEACRTARGIAITEDDHGAEIRVKQQLALIARRRGRRAQSEELLKEILQYAESTGDLVWQARVLDNLGVIYLEQRDFSAAADYFARSLEIEKRRKFLPGQVDATVQLTMAYMNLDRFSEAERLLKEALKIDEAMGSDLGRASILSNLGEVYTTTGRFDESRRALDEALSLYRVANIQHGEGVITRCLARLEGACGNEDAARRLYEQAASVASEIGDGFEEMRARLDLARLYGRQGDTVSAWENLEQAGNLADALGDWGVCAWALEARGQIAAQGANYSGARELLTEAANVYRAHGAEADFKRLRRMQDALPPK